MAIFGGAGDSCDAEDGGGKSQKCQDNGHWNKVREAATRRNQIGEEATVFSFY
jgi:hypothetical protein